MAKAGMSKVLPRWFLRIRFCYRQRMANAETSGSVEHSGRVINQQRARWINAHFGDKCLPELWSLLGGVVSDLHPARTGAGPPP